MGTGPKRPMLCGLLPALVVVSGAACAQPDASPDEPRAPIHDHVPLEVDSTLGWDELLERTVVNFPRYVELAARDAEARAWTRRAGRWLAASPSVDISYLSDAAVEDYGLAEYELGLALPLWRAGQRRAARAVGTSATREAEAAQAALEWELAGGLRSALWDIERAANALERARDAVGVATDVQRVVERRHSAGELPLADTLLARTSVLERESALLGAQAELVDAERAYETLTGLTIRPARFAESLTQRSDFDATHPLLELVDAEVERARAELDYTRQRAGGNPVLNVGSRRQRDPLTDFYVDSVGVAVSIPFGGGAHRATETSAAGRQLARAEAARGTTLRELETALHEALHTLEVTERALELAKERAAIAERHHGMGRTAFEAGEISLVDLLRREESARLAGNEAARLRIARGRTIAEVNQAIGELP